MTFTSTSAPAIYVGKVTDFDVDALVGCLNNNEKDKLSRLRRVADQQLYIVAHSLKRFVLARYMDVSPASLLFDTEVNGKPFCTNPDAPYFNLSHSGQWVVVAVSIDTPVGVDIEFERAVDKDGIVKRIGSDVEVAAYQQSVTQQQHFLCLWTQKEAVSKACGQGISVGLSSIPCSGEVGVFDLSFIGVDYVSHTYPFTDKGVISFVISTHDVPSILTVKNAKNPNSEQLFELDTITL
jgi:4'-phosphopantetheinyl transferase